MNSSELVAGFRKKHGLSQLHMGVILGVHPITISRWERSSSPLPPKYRRMLETAKVKKVRGVVTITYSVTHTFYVTE